MPNIWDGTHLFLWQANQVFNGDVNAMISQAKDLGITGVIIKFANGSLVNDPVSVAYMDQFQNLVQPFKSAGFTVGGWIYQYLMDVTGEVDACTLAIEAGADWIVLDSEIDVSGKTQEVQQFGKLLRERHPNIPLGLSSFAISNYHPEVPFNEYSQFIDVMMPQIYWHEMGWDVGVAYNASITSYQRYNKPIAPTGEATGGSTSADMARFVQLALGSGIQGISWWDWQDANAEELQAIKDNLIKRRSPIAGDVNVNDPYSTAIQYVIQKSIMHVDVQGNFNPDQSVTRGMLAQVIYNIETNNAPSTPPTRIANDVSSTGPYANAIQYVLDKGIMHVDSLGNFNPNQEVTRGMLSQVIFNIDSISSPNQPLPGSTPTTSKIANDVTETDPFSHAIQYVLIKGIMHVDDQGNFYPNQTLTRGMMSQVIYNIDQMGGHL